MAELGISKCAGPNCSQKWYRLGEGKLFTFHVKLPGPEPRRTLKNVWLCESCFVSWEPMMHAGNHVVLVPLQREAI
jgi:hypothetical protein